MANPEHLAILKRGVDAWNKWRVSNLLVRPDLWDADLGGADLRRALLNRVGIRHGDNNLR